jgi:nucleoside-diphosphate-sugar epimerase
MNPIRVKNLNRTDSVKAALKAAEYGGGRSVVIDLSTGNLYVATGLDLAQVVDPYTGEPIVLPPYIDFVPPYELSEHSFLDEVFSTPDGGFCYRNGISLCVRPVSRQSWTRAIIEGLIDSQ